jgi:probable rRNA maturation factor
MMVGDSIENAPPESRAADGGKRPGIVARVDAADPGRLLAPAARAGLLARATEAARYIGRAGEIRVRHVADAEMAAAHARYSGVPGTTDVLTFDLSEGASARGENLDVDILVCVDEARRQAASRGLTVERELLLYVLHGVLHCLGFDDHDEDAAARMHAEEDRVLEAIGVGATFSAGHVPPPKRDERGA